MIEAFIERMAAFVSQIKRWLKPEGVFFVGYQEGDVMPKTEDAHTTVFTEALRRNGMLYQVEDISEQVYELLRKKRKAAPKHKEEFVAEGHQNWYDMLIWQTEYAQVPLKEFKEKLARYLYVIRK